MQQKKQFEMIVEQLGSQHYRMMYIPEGAR